MTNDLLLDIINKVIAEGEATQKDVDIFKDYIPDSPDNCVAIYEYNATLLPMGAEANVRRFQVVARNKSSNLSMVKCWDIFNKIKPVEGISILNNRPCIIQMLNTPIKIDTDTSNRVKYAFNMAITSQLN